MKCSALEFYDIAVYGGIRGIYNEKIMDENFETISECSSFTLTTISVN